MSEASFVNVLACDANAKFENDDVPTNPIVAAAETDDSKDLPFKFPVLALYSKPPVAPPAPTVSVFFKFCALPPADEDGEKTI